MALFSSGFLLLSLSFHGGAGVHPARPSSPQGCTPELKPYSQQSAPRNA